MHFLFHNDNFCIVIYGFLDSLEIQKAVLDIRFIDSNYVYFVAVSIDVMIIASCIVIIDLTHTLSP